MKNTTGVKYFIPILTIYFATFLLTTSTAFGVETKTIEANGAEVIYVEQGNGPLMILAHGSLSDHRRWIKDHMPLLAENYRVVAYSARYHGTSEWDESWPPLSMDLYADDLGAFIKALDDGPAHLVGWSMGATIAHRTALKYPDLVRSAYLFEGAAALERSEAQNAEFTKIRNAFIAESWKLADENRHKEAAAALLDAVVGKEGFFDTLPEGPQKAIGSKGKLLSDYYHATMNPKSRFTCDEIKESTVPTIFVIGKNTREHFAVLLGEHYQPCFGLERIVEVPEAGHVWPGAKFNDFVVSVQEFASKH